MTEYEMGLHDAAKADNITKSFLLQTCLDVMSDGHSRAMADEYWRGVYDIVAERI